MPTRTKQPPPQRGASTQLATRIGALREALLAWLDADTCWQEEDLRALAARFDLPYVALRLIDGERITGLTVRDLEEWERWQGREVLTQLICEEDRRCHA